MFVHYTTKTRSGLYMWSAREHVMTSTKNTEETFSVVSLPVISGWSFPLDWRGKYGEIAGDFALNIIQYQYFYFYKYELVHYPEIRKKQSRINTAAVTNKKLNLLCWHEGKRM